MADTRPDIDTFFKIVDESMVFIGDKLEVRIPCRYSVYDLLEVTEHVRTIAIFEMIVNDTYSYGLILPNVIVMNPTSVDRATINEVDYRVCTFLKGDKFMLSTTVLKETFVPYYLYKEFINLGNMPSFLNYNDTALLFSNVEEMCDFNLKASPAILEMLYAHLYRDPDNLYVKYRYTDMSKNPVFIGTRDVAFGTESTTSKLIGAYFNDGVNSALVNASDRHYYLEDMLRK